MRELEERQEAGHKIFRTPKYIMAQIKGRKSLINFLIWNFETLFSFKKNLYINYVKKMQNIVIAIMTISSYIYSTCMWFIYTHTYTLHFHHHCFEHLHFSSGNKTSYINQVLFKKKKAQEYYTCFITGTYSCRMQVQSKAGIRLTAELCFLSEFLKGTQQEEVEDTQLVLYSS